MAAGSQEGRMRRDPAASLTDDHIVEILSRLPVKSICRSMCVSKHWLALISNPDHRKKLPQTLAGFIYRTYSRERFPDSARHFTNVVSSKPPLIRPSLSFLPGHGDITVIDCCSGMLLCSRRIAGVLNYVVCNPATEEWVELPYSGQDVDFRKSRLGFDPAASPHFHVFEFVETGVDPPDIFGSTFVNGLEIYSSRTGEWAHVDNGWSDDVCLSDDLSSVFFNGFLHVFEYEKENVLVVDTEGQAWRTLTAPRGNDDGFIGQSQGHLYYLNTIEEYDFDLVVYVLEDYATNEWILKHRVKTSKLLGSNIFSRMPLYNVISIHPECNQLFFVSALDDTIRCYDMDRRQVHVIRYVGWKRNSRCLPYVPLFSESLTGQN